MRQLVCVGTHMHPHLAILVKWLCLQEDPRTALCPQHFLCVLVCSMSASLTRTENSGLVPGTVVRKAGTASPEGFELSKSGLRDRHGCGSPGVALGQRVALD